MNVPIKDYPSADSGIFHNPPVRLIRLAFGKNRKLSNKEMRALDGFLDHRSEDQIAEVTQLLEDANDWAHLVLLEESRKADPKGKYFFAERPFKMPDESVVFRGVWKLVGKRSGRWGGKSVPLSPENHKAYDADTVRRITVEQWMRLATLRACCHGEETGHDSEQVLGVALLAMCRLGWYMRQLTVRDREPDARRGRRVSEGARRGHETVHGTLSEKREEWARLQSEVDGLRQQHVTWTRSQVFRKVAEKYSVSPRTLRRRMHW